MKATAHPKASTPAEACRAAASVRSVKAHIGKQPRARARVAPPPARRRPSSAVLRPGGLPCRARSLLPLPPAAPLRAWRRLQQRETSLVSLVLAGRWHPRPWTETASPPARKGRGCFWSQSGKSQAASRAGARLPPCLWRPGCLASAVAANWAGALR